MTVHTIYAEGPQNPHEREGYAADELNDRQRRAESVAERHIRTNSPEWSEWLSGRLSDEEVARYVAAMIDDDVATSVRLDALTFREEFTEYVASCNPWDHRTFAAEVEREH